MKATGIVRRIDDLGRVVIPKEIRRTLRIREGDPLEIFTDREGQVILKKYSPIGELAVFAKQYAESLAQTLGCTVCVTDNDMVIAAEGMGRKEFQEKSVCKDFEKILQARECVNERKGSTKFSVIVEGAEEYEEEIICPIICEGDVIGSVVLLRRADKKKFGESEEKVAMSAAAFLGKQMEQ